MNKLFKLGLEHLLLSKIQRIGAPSSKSFQIQERLKKIDIEMAKLKAAIPAQYKKIKGTPWKD